MEFNQQRATFWLVAAVFAIQAAVILVSVGACALFARELITTDATCGKETRLLDLMGNMLSSALAFAAGRTSR